MEILLQLAHWLDDYLEDDAVPSSSLQKPSTTLMRTRYRVSPGETFRVQLVDLEHIHWLKNTVQTGTPDCIEQTENGSAEGNYTFLAIGPGRTRVTLLVARKDNLAMGLAHFYVEVADDIFEKVLDIEAQDRRGREPPSALRDITNRQNRQ